MLVFSFINSYDWKRGVRIRVRAQIPGEHCRNFIQSENVPYFPPPPGWRVTVPFRRAEIASATFGWTARISATGTSMSTAISLPNVSMNEA